MYTPAPPPPKPKPVDARVAVLEARIALALKHIDAGSENPTWAMAKARAALIG